MGKLETNDVYLQEYRDRWPERERKRERVANTSLDGISLLHLILGH
jgi:hypothetical protein